jgi:curved DNA-binding protein CbpA
MSAGSDDLYALLGVSSDATWPEIRQRYLEMVERYHPDRHQGNPLGELAGERLRRVNHAYAVLCDPVRRAEYDVQSGRKGGQAGTGSWRESGEPPQPQDRLSGPRALRWLGVLLLVVLAIRVIPIIARAMARLFGSGTGLAAAGLVLATVAAGLLLSRRSSRARRS